MHTERLKLMSTLLREIAANPAQRGAFNLKAWVSTKMGGAVYEADPDDLPEEMIEQQEDGCVLVDVTRECGFAACACGWAGSDPRFIAQGFCLSWNLAPVYHATGDSNWSAVRSFFDLGAEAAYELFMSENYALDDRQNPLAVADRIDAMIAEAA